MSDMIMWSPGVTLEQIEREVILKAYAHYRQNKTTTAGALGISVRTLDERVKKYADETTAAEEALENDRTDRERQLARARGVHPNQYDTSSTPSEFSERSRSQPAQNAPAQQAVPLSQRIKVQDVLPQQAAAGGNRKHGR